MINKPLISQTQSSPQFAVQRYTLLIVGIVYGFMAQVYTTIYFRVTLDSGSAGLVSLQNFTAYRPYQYRILVPAIVHILARLTHADSYQIVPIYEYCEWIAAFICFWIFRSYLATFTDQKSSTLLSFALLPVLLFLHVSCAMSHYPYDTPQIALFTLGLLALRRSDYRMFYFALIIGTLNRESTLLLIFAYGLVNFGKVNTKNYIIQLLCQVAIFGAIKLGLDHIFQFNPGAPTEDHVIYNRKLILSLLHLQPVIFGTFALSACATIVFAIQHKLVPEFARRLLWLIPIYLAVMYKVGILDEIRAYNEMVPVVLIPILLVIHGTLVPLQNSRPIELQNTDKASKLNAA